MNYFVTGATGFIGGRLVHKLLTERTGTIFCLVRERSIGRLEARMELWGDEAMERVVPVIGDLAESRLGLTDSQMAQLDETGVDHVVHLAAIYDITASLQAQTRANVDGTRHTVQVANALGARMHHVSSIAAGGLYPGRWTEQMLTEASAGLDDPYFATKHDAEVILRDEAKVPFRVYRPSIVVGDSRTGEIDKVDGPYYFFRLITMLGNRLPAWLPLISPEGGTINLVPVDYVVDAMDHIMHLGEEWDGRTFHLVDPAPQTVGQLLDMVAEIVGGPRFPVRVEAGLLEVVPGTVRDIIGAVTPVQQTLELLLRQVGIPVETLKFLDWPTTYTDSNTRTALEGTGIAVPPLRSYLERLYFYWLRELSGMKGGKGGGLRGRVAGRNVMITGASDGIGYEVAKKLADAGAHVLLVSRTRHKLEAVRDEIEAAGGVASVHPCDLSEDEDVLRMTKEVITQHGHVDVLINNAGRSIRRSVKLSLDRFHDYERTMQLNYFGAVRLTLELLPSMIERGGGQIVNISSIGVQTNMPRFSAYVASKAALDAFGRCISSELFDDNIVVTSVYMPLVRTKMIAPTSQYKYFPALTPDEAADRVLDAVTRRPKKVATVLGTAGQLAYALAPKALDAVMHRGFSLFPDTKAARGESGDNRADEATRRRKAMRRATADDDGSKATRDRLIYAWLLKGLHW